MAHADDAQRIVPHLWFDDRAEEAASFYASLFDDSAIGATTRYGKAGFEIHGRPEGSVMSVDFDIAGYELVALNGGPAFELTPAISFFVTCETEAEVDALWGALSEDGGVLMPLDRYDWSEKYGWVEDRYGLSWQVALGKLEDVGQKITPSLLFVGDRLGRAEEAVRRYTGIFEDSEITGILRYGPGEEGPEGTMKHAQFRLDGETFMAMDGPGEHDFDFSEALSLLVRCGSQEEVDRLWEALGRGGDPAARQCGWLKDEFGVSWQVCPTVLQEMLRDPDAEKVERVTEAFLPMKKLDIPALERAYRG
jgi:predicted 3-demethylubiquinone-9 3-methyltransferase (glyoxalase superfamily)